MFRIYLHSMRGSEWLSLEGNLAGAGVGELKGGRHTLAPANNSPRLRGHIRLAPADSSATVRMAGMPPLVRS